MTTRREFIKEAGTGAVALGAMNGFGLTHGVDARTETKSKVVVARDSALHAPDGTLDPARVSALLDRAIFSYTGHKRAVDAWKRIIEDGDAKDKVIGLKTNG